MLYQNRYVSIEGIPGIGKSAIVKNIANMLFERHVFKDGILYITLRDCNSLEGLFKKTFMSIKMFKSDLRNSINRNHDSNIESNELYWEILKVLKDFEMLIIFDNCREIIAKDQTAFRGFIQDILEKLPKMKMIITCMNSVPLMNDVKARIFKVGKLKNKQVLELLKLNSESIIAHNKDFKELIEADPDFKSKTKTNILDHELFSVLDGHPLSIVILSSLRKSMSLLEIFELLRMVKDKYSANEINQSTLSLMLSVEASLIFAKKENQLSYEALLIMSVSPSGFLKQHLFEIFGQGWFEIENLLVSRQLINPKVSVLSRNNEIDQFTMDLALEKVIRSRTNSEELEEAYRKVLIKMMTILTELLDERYDRQPFINDTICIYEGNIWSLIHKYQEDIISEKSDENDSNKSWSNSSGFNDLLSPNAGNNLLKIPHSEFKANAYIRSGTYRERKKSMLKTLFTGISNDKNDESKLSNKTQNNSDSQQFEVKSPANEFNSIKNLIKNFVVTKIVSENISPEKHGKIGTEPIIEETESVQSDIFTDVLDYKDIKIEFLDKREHNDAQTIKMIISQYNSSEVNKYNNKNFGNLLLNKILNIAAIKSSSARKDSKVPIEVSQFDDNKNEITSIYAEGFDDRDIESAKHKRRRSKSLRAQFVHHNDKAFKNKRISSKCSEYGQMLILFTSNLIV